MLLLFMDIRNTIITGLSNRSAQEFAFRFFHRPVDEFVVEIIQYDALLSLQKRNVHSQQSWLLLLTSLMIPHRMMLF